MYLVLFLHDLYVFMAFLYNEFIRKLSSHFFNRRYALDYIMLVSNIYDNILI